MLPFRIKICGLTDPANVRPTVEAGAQALGLNFFSGSKRYIGPEQAVTVGAQIPDGITRVGVFVDDLPPLIFMRHYFFGYPVLNYLQLHGDESVDQLKHLTKIVAQFKTGLVSKHTRPRLIKAFRLKSDPESEIGRYLDDCRKKKIELAAMLIDAFSTAGHGGTGERADWAALGRWTDRRGIPLILAGGITPENVAEAIATVRPDAIDTASGVESAPGIKDPDKVRRLVAAAKAAWKSIE